MKKVKRILTLLLVVNLFSISLILYGVDKDGVSNGKDVTFKTYLKDKNLFVIEDKNLWNYLNKNTPKFDFDTLDKQYFLFDNSTKKFFKGIEDKKGMYIHFPPVDKDTLPLGLTLMFEGVEYNKDYVKVWVRTTEEVKLLTEKDLKELKKQIQENNKKIKK